MFKPRTILLVDDSAADLDLLFDLLEGEEYRLLIAENGEAALQRSMLAKPDIILMECLLPGMDGYDCCRRLRANAELSHIPVIMMSSGEDETARKQSFQAGACAYLVKPVIKEEVTAILKNQIEILQLREALQSANQSETRSFDEFDTVVDLIAHDMKSPIVCITGFAEELSEQFIEAEVVEEWNEFLGYIHKSACDVDVILDALVLLKNLRVRQWKKNETSSLESIIANVTTRYEQVPYTRPLALRSDLGNFSVLTQTALFEELLLILFHNLSHLVESKDTLQLSLTTKRINSHSLLLRINAHTRALDDAELVNLLEPLQGKIRKRVKDANILLLCAQKIISHLGINAWAEHGPENTLTICLTLETRD
jgi:CheY-like chemotaxis protein